MFRAEIFLACIALTTAFHFESQFNKDLDDHWVAFKAKHQKTYSDRYEEAERRVIWEGNLAYIMNHNLEYDMGKHEYFLGMNQYSDWTHPEFVGMMNSYQHDGVMHGNLPRHEYSDEGAASTVDWRQKNLVTSVKNQGQCGSCWAFSAVGVIEGAYAKKTGKLVDLSEQQLVDCANGIWLSHGCKGGSPYAALNYAHIRGVETLKQYPYVAKADKCTFSRSSVVAHINGVKAVKSGDEGALADAVSSIGPVSVAIDANHPAFMHYKGGVYSSTECSSTRLDHGVLAVGYTSDAWIVKNSWTENWGEKGYVRMARNKGNMCGIATAACYATA